MIEKMPDVIWARRHPKGNDWYEMSELADPDSDGGLGGTRYHHQRVVDAKDTRIAELEEALRDAGWLP